MVREFWRQNREEFRGILSGEIARRLAGKRDGPVSGPFPAFVFHAVRPDALETQFRFLVRNGYTTLTADELAGATSVSREAPTRAVALTFDDGLGSFWATAFPLLKKYGLRAILFVTPSRLSETDIVYPTLEDTWTGRASLEEVEARERTARYLTWRELRCLHNSGIVDVQSHSSTHRRIAATPRIVDFAHPGMRTRGWDHLALGSPVFEGASRSSGCRAYTPEPRLTSELVRFVADHGGIAFFRRRRWRRELTLKCRAVIETLEEGGRVESIAAAVAAVRREMVGSREILEGRLLGKRIRHYCYPWFEGSARADKIAVECDYVSVHYGVSPGERNDGIAPGSLVRIPRLDECYLRCLPGHGRQTLRSVWLEKLVRYGVMTPARRLSG